jgi:hypothetical protein
MQFGRVVGVGLAVLGFLLIFLELGFFMNAGKPQLRRNAEQREFDPHQRYDRSRHHLPMLPGILGGAFVIGGALIFLKARKEDEPKGAAQ